MNRTKKKWPTNCNRLQFYRRNPFQIYSDQKTTISAVDLGLLEELWGGSPSGTHTFAVVISAV